VRSPLPLYVAVSAVTGASVLLGLRLMRDYPWLLATFSGVGLGVLVFMTLQAVDRLRRETAERRQRRLRR
jgi:threonine/homoserine/homoserine lactone efflux protein